ncbi:MAG TPA: glycosyltransferase family 4 protein [Pyrinomonadaceae bacterium]|nr:glycosyltransferase family 4 protein [Acidobacteriota bacterium]HQZ95862.1 glycosyltransferase family 4 protein [Pyrinomonadaceae bacterium]
MAGRTQQPTIAHILPWKAIGGTELATLRMARVTREAGFRNVFFVLRDCDEVAELFRAENFEVCEFTEIEPSIRHFVNYKAESSKLARQFREVKADLIHCADLRGSFYATLAAFLSRIPIVSHVRGQQPEIPKRDQLFLKAVKKWIFVSRNSRQSFGMHVRDSRAAVIYDGIDIDNVEDSDRAQNRAEIRREFGIEGKTKIIGMVARVAPQKDFFTLARAVRELKGKGIDFKVLIVGSISKEAVNKTHFLEIQKLLGELKIADRFIFTDFRTDVEKFFDSFDVNVLSSHGEGFGLVLLEAMARKIPVVATNVGGIPEIIEHGMNGLLCQHENSEELAAAIESLLLNSNYRSRIAAAGFKRVKEDFSRQKFAIDIVDFYRGILN